MNAALNETLLYTTDGTADHAIVGTCEIAGLGFGVVKTCNLQRVADTRELKDCRNAARGFLMENPGFELDVNSNFTSGVEEPEIGDAITFPFIAVVGIIIPPVAINWEQGGERGLSIKAKAWASMQDGALYTWNGTTWTYPD